MLTDRFRGRYYSPRAATMQQANEDAETLRRVDAIGDATLSQAIREALARRSDAARVEAMNDDERAAWDAAEAARLDAWIPDLSNQLDDAERESLNTFYTDEAAVRLVVPPFALLQLNTDVRRKVMAFLLCTSQDHALRADAAKRSLRCPSDKHETTRSFFILRRYRVTRSQYSRTAARPRPSSAAPLHDSTAALVDTLFHHTAALRVVCTELRTDAVALSSAANSEATPRSGSANFIVATPRSTTRPSSASCAHARCQAAAPTRFEIYCCGKTPAPCLRHRSAGELPSTAILPQGHPRGILACCARAL